MVVFDFTNIGIGQLIGLALVIIIFPLGLWNMKRMKQKKLEEEEQFSGMGSQEIAIPSSEGISSNDPATAGMETPEAEIPLKTYIDQYKSQYSKEALRSALINNGYDSTLVDTCLEKYF